LLIAFIIFTRLSAAGEKNPLNDKKFILGSACYHVDLIEWLRRQNAGRKLNKKMKTITKPAVIIGLLAGLAIPALAEENEQTVKWNDLPAAVQTTITANAHSGKVKKIEVETENGATTYEAKVKSDDEKIEIEVAADGTLLETETKGLDLDDLPAAVRTTIKANANGGKVKEIEMETEKGVTTYEAEAKASGDKETKIKVAADGTLISTKSEDEDDDKDGDHEGKDDDDKDGK
jgi:uncharacterized membrane protein YkoI